MQLAEERRQAIVDAVEREGRVLAVELARTLDISEDTVRRDLRDLDAQVAPDRVFRGVQGARQFDGQHPSFALDGIDNRLTALFR